MITERTILIVGSALVIVAFSLSLCIRAHARDVDGRYAGSPLKSWFDHLASGRGPCCSDADGKTVEDPDWDVKDGHYRVRLDGNWIDVPDDAVITVPNLAGRAIVWPIQWGGGPIQIRCFMPGAGT